MMKKMILIFVLNVIIILPVTVFSEGLEINGFVRNYSGILLEGDNDYSIVQNTLDLSFKKSEGDIGFVSNIFVYQYPSKENYFGIRELYMDYYSESVDLRIGKQQIIWGQADGVFITDIVSPKNLTEFLLWDFNEIRMGVTAAKGKYYINSDNSLELVWIPMFTPTLMPEEGSIWHPKMSFPLEPSFDMTKSEVDKNLNNSELFGRYSLNLSWIDLQVMGGYTFDDDPSIHVKRGFSIDSVTGTKYLSSMVVSPEYHRLNVGGLSFSADLTSFILRGEGAYYNNKYFQTADPIASDGLIKKDYINYVVGIDKTVGEWKLSTQFIQKIILDYEDNLIGDEMDNLATILVSKSFMREKLRLELFSYVGFNNEDALIRLKGYYYPSDAFGIEFGSNVFVGNEGTFGQFNGNNMVYAKIKYNF